METNFFHWLEKINKYRILLNVEAKMKSRNTKSIITKQFY
jgi:hypothetical protein